MGTRVTLNVPDRLCGWRIGSAPSWPRLIFHSNKVMKLVSRQGGMDSDRASSAADAARI